MEKSANSQAPVA